MDKEFINIIHNTKLLFSEYNYLKNKLFGNCSFLLLDAETENSAEYKRYSMLFRLFFVNFRSEDFYNNLERPEYKDIKTVLQFEVIT